MKRKILLLIITIFTILLTGCSKINNSTDNNQDDFMSYIEKNYVKFDWFDDNIKFDDIKDFSSYDEYFITKDGNLFQYNLEKKFKSTNKNYEQINSSLNFVRFVRYDIVDDNNNYYRYTEGINKSDEKEWDSDLNNLCNKIYINYPNVYSIGNEWRVYRHQYLLYEDNNLYIFKYKKKSNAINISGESTCIFEKEIVEPSVINNEKFISATGYIFKTDKSFYKTQTKEIKSEYADEEDYTTDSITKMEISKYYDDIYYFNGSVLILKDDLNHIYINKDKDGYWFGFKG